MDQTPFTPEQLVEISGLEQALAGARKLRDFFGSFPDPGEFSVGEGDKEEEVGRLSAWLAAKTYHTYGLSNAQKIGDLLASNNISYDNEWNAFFVSALEHPEQLNTLKNNPSEFFKTDRLQDTRAIASDAGYLGRQIAKEILKRGEEIAQMFSSQTLEKGFREKLSALSSIQLYYAEDHLEQIFESTYKANSSYSHSKLLIPGSWLESYQLKYLMTELENKISEAFIREEEKLKPEAERIITEHVRNSPKGKTLDRNVEYFLGSAASKETAERLLEEHAAVILVEAFTSHGHSAIAKSKTQEKEIFERLINCTRSEYNRLDDLLQEEIEKRLAFLRSPAWLEQFAKRLEEESPKAELHKDVDGTLNAWSTGLENQRAAIINLTTAPAEQQTPEAMESLYWSLRENLVDVKRMGIFSLAAADRFHFVPRKGDITLRNFAEKASKLRERGQFLLPNSPLSPERICQHLEKFTLAECRRAQASLDDSQLNLDFTSEFMFRVCSMNPLTYAVAGAPKGQEYKFSWKDFFERHAEAVKTPEASTEDAIKKRELLIAEQVKALSKQLNEDQFGYEVETSLHLERANLYQEALSAWTHIPPEKALAAANKLAQVYHNSLGEHPIEREIKKGAPRFVAQFAGNPNLAKLGDSTVMEELFDTYVQAKRVLRKSKHFIKKDGPHTWKILDGNGYILEHGFYSEQEAQIWIGRETQNNATVDRLLAEGLANESQKKSLMFIVELMDSKKPISLEKESAENLFAHIRNADYLIEAVSSYDGLKKYIKQAEPKDPAVTNGLNWETPLFKFYVLGDRDPRHFTIGIETDCCQALGSAGEDAAIDSFVNGLAGVLVMDLRVGNTWRTAFQSYFHWVPEAPGYILDNIESDAKVQKLVEQVTGLSPQKLYAAWAAEIKTRNPKLKYIGLGKSYTKIKMDGLAELSLESDPRRFHEEVADNPYSDFSYYDAANLLDTDFSKKELEEESIGPIDDDEEEEGEEGVKPWVSALNSFYSNFGRNDQRRFGSLLVGYPAALHYFKRYLIELGKQRGFTDPRAEERSISYLEKKIFGKRAGWNLGLVRLARAARFWRRLNK